MTLEDAARTALDNDPDEYFCVVCGRPRRHKYCPAKGRGGVDHKVMPRNEMSIDLQIFLYLLAKPSRGTR